MKQLKVIGILTCLLLLTCGCGKEEEENLDMTQTTAATEAETEETTEETTEEETTEAETATEETTEETSEIDAEIIMTDTTLSTDILPEETEGEANVTTNLPSTPGGQPVMTVPAPTDPPVNNAIPIPNPNGDALTFQFGNNSLRVGDSAESFVNTVSPNNYESAPSCYENGEDIVYYYDDFTLFVWNNNGSYQTVGIDIGSAGASTQKGITVGSTVTDVISAYGNNYTEEGMEYVYIYDDCNVRITIVDGEVHYISINKDI